MRVQAFLNHMCTDMLAQLRPGNGTPDALVRPTQQAKFGDYQVNGALALAKRLGENPRALAGELADAVAKQPCISKAEVAGPGFVNLHLSQNFIVEELSSQLRDSQLAIPTASEIDDVIVDFSSPNIAKQMHVGHLRSTILGDALVRILRAVGHRVRGDNHLGDWGTQFGLLIAGMRDFGSREALDDEPIKELERVYTEASKRAKQDTAFAESARAELRKLQDGDETNRQEWQTFISATRTHLDSVYAKLGIDFDLWLGESHYHGMLQGIVENLSEKRIAREDDGAVCVFFSELEGAPKELAKIDTPLIVQKKDGAFLYSTTDLATAKHRAEDLGANRAIYVVDVRQSLHFKQVFEICHRLGLKLKLDHVGFGTILGKDGKPLRTRDGGVISLAGLLDEAEARAKQRLNEQGVAVDDVAEAARVIGIGAVKYADLRQNRLSDYRFDWDKMLSFQGNASPYIQYGYARICSILRKLKDESSEHKLGTDAIDSMETREALAKALSSTQLTSDAEWLLGKELLKFADVVHQAAETLQPHLICDHLFAITKEFSAFYEQCSILKAEGHEQRARLTLALLAALQLRFGLKLLGIDTLDRM